MSRETEALFREMNRFMEEHEFDTDEEAFQAFMDYVNMNPAEEHTHEMDAYDYLEKAQDARTAATAIKYAKKALELAPSLIEAELVIAVHKSKSTGELQSAVEQLLKKEEQNLAQQDITEATCGGDYYQILETRPYIRLYKQYIDTLVELGKLRKAVEACKKVLLLNENDNLGVRYTLMALYALLEEREAAEALYQKSPDSASGFMLLPLVALYYKQDDEAKAIDCLTRLCSKNPAVKQAVRLLKKEDADEIMDVMCCPYYAPYSKEEFILAYIENALLYQTIHTDFLSWIEKHIPAKTTSKPRGRKKKSK